MLIILAVISINLLLNGNIIGRAEQSKEMYQVAQIREELSLVLGDAGVEKALNKEYNENGFLDEFILKQEPDTEILDNIIIKDGHAFELDRSVPKLGEYTGKKEDLAIPDLEVTTVVADDYRTATITINAKEEENGISKIEIIQAGFVIKEYTYDNKKEPITENFIAKQNGEYIVKVYSKINVSKITKVEGLVATVKYSPNGDETYKKAHSVKVTVDDSIDKVKSIKYQWLQTTKEPAANTFVDSCNNGGTITKDGLNGSWYLWTLLETESEKTNIGRSEAFYFDNEGPTVTVTPTPLTATSFKLTATVTDAHIGQVTECQFYVGGILKDTVKIQNGKAEYTMTGAVTGNTNCYVIAKDILENPTKKEVVGETKLYTWEKYNYTIKQIYVEDEVMDSYELNIPTSMKHNFGNDPYLDEEEGYGLRGGTICTVNENDAYDHEGQWVIINYYESHHVEVYYLKQKINYRRYISTKYTAKLINKYTPNGNPLERVRETSRSVFNDDDVTSGYYYKYIGET